MSRDPVISQADDDLEKVVDVMEEHRVRRIPVVDENNQIVGSRASFFPAAYTPITTVGSSR